MADYNSSYTGQQIDNAVGKALNPDTTPTASSSALLTSGGAKSALDLKAPLASPALTGSPTAPTQSASDNSTKIATTAFVKTGLATKQNTLTFDDAPTNGSNNPVKSDGIYDALTGKLSYQAFTVPSNTRDVFNVPSGARFFLIFVVTNDACILRTNSSGAITAEWLGAGGHSNIIFSNNTITYENPTNVGAFMYAIDLSGSTITLTSSEPIS